MRGAMERLRAREPALLLTVLFAVAVVVSLVACCRQCTTVTLISSNEKSDLLREIAGSWNRTAGLDVRCGRVEVVRVESGRAEGALARGWDVPNVKPPDVWSPAASSWTLLLKQHLADRGSADIVPPVPPSIFQSPLVIGMPEEMARTIGWPARQVSWSEVLALAVDPTGWSRYSRPDLGPFKFGKTDPKVSTSGLHVLVGTYFASRNRLPIEADVEDPVVRDYVAAVERSAVYGNTVAELLRRLRDADDRGQPLSFVSAIALEEKQVWDYNRGVVVGDGDERQGPEPRMKLVAIYPSDGTLVADHPYVVPNAPWVTDEKRRVADAFLRHLQSEPIQRLFERQALRDHLGHAGELIRSSPWLSAAGASRALRLPTPRTLERIQRSWEDLRKRA
ncbi:MAG TPA: substrate-binding domain-containing protein [Candidatus Limnocylindria bacterium]|nr:substrate-binding domain-containing protein [Candidatus Limnocylindria bacterium]